MSAILLLIFFFPYPSHEGVQNFSISGLVGGATYYRVVSKDVGEASVKGKQQGYGFVATSSGRSNQFLGDNLPHGEGP